MAAEPAPGEETAARELVRYLAMLGGAPVELHRDEPSGAPVRILVGARAWQEIDGLPVDEVRDDGFVLDAAPERIALAANDRGTLYAAYELIERLGARWYAPGPENEYLPAAEIWRFRSRPLEDPAGNHWVFHRAIEDRAEKGVPLSYYGYNPHSTFAHAPFSAGRRFHQDIRWLHGRGFVGAEFQGEGTLWGFYGLNHVVQARTMWDVDSTPCRRTTSAVSTGRPPGRCGSFTKPSSRPSWSTSR